MMILRLLLVVYVLFSPPGEVGAFVLDNGDFQRGNLTGWTVYTTQNGSLGGEGFPRCEDFDIVGDGHRSKSAVFKVGRRQYKAEGPSLAGGGILTNIRLDAGSVVISAEIASSYFSPHDDRRNLAGGMFELLLDGVVIATHDFGPILNHSTLNARLKGSTQVNAGLHELRIRIRRPFKSLSHDIAPHQYIDNIRIHHSPH